jgi:hypothetical protein
MPKITPFWFGWTNADGVTAMLCLSATLSGGMVIAQDAVPVEQVVVAEQAEQPAAQAEEEVAREVIVEAPDVLMGENALEVALDPQLLLLQRYARTQCALLRRVCDLQPEQERHLAVVSQPAWLRDEIKEATDSPVKRAAAGIARFLGGRVPANRRNQPHEISLQVRQAIDAHIASQLTEQQAAMFKEECQSRDAFRREAQAQTLVTVLDRRLYLTEAQRQALLPLIAESLKQELYWQFYFQNDHYLPSIPRSVFTKVLDDEQVDALAGLNTHNYELHQIEVQLIGQQPLIMIEK